MEHDFLVRIMKNKKFGYGYQLEYRLDGELDIVDRRPYGFDDAHEMAKKFVEDTSKSLGFSFNPGTAILFDIDEEDAISLVESALFRRAIGFSYYNEKWERRANSMTLTKRNQKYVPPELDAIVAYLEHKRQHTKPLRKTPKNGDE